jgi:hypothetical protein
MKSEGAAEPRLRAAGPVRVTLPAQVAYDPAALKKSIRSIVERLGCPTCFSGADCLFQMERRFVVDATQQANPDPTPWEPDPEAWQLARRLTAGLAKPVKYDIDKVLQAVDKVIDLIGPHPCISGFDVLFRDELIVVNEQLQAQKF